MDPCVLYSVYRRIYEKRRERRWDVHPINRSRYTDGAYRNLYTKLREDNEKFFNFFRMGVASFDELVLKMRYTIRTKQDLIQGLAFSPEEMLTVTLRYLGSGCTYRDLHRMFRIGTTTASYIIPTVCRILWITLQSDVFPQFSEEFWLQTADGFTKSAHFPHCIGAIDEKHVRIVRPKLSGSLSNNYFSIVLLAVADSSYRFLYIDVGSYKKDSGSKIFQNSTLFRSLEEDSLNIPKQEKVSENTIPLPYVIVGDEAFGISTHMMRPYPRNHLTKKQKVFNYRLSTARRYVECAFGILTNKWRIFHRPLNLKNQNYVNIIKASCALHNYVHQRDGVNFQETLEINGLYDGETIRHLERGRMSAYAYRDAFSDYFCTPEGALPWQDSKI